MAIVPNLVPESLVPGAKPVPPAGFTQLEEKITNGLPHRIRLDGNTTLVLVLPTGLATAWREAGLDEVVSTSETEMAPPVRGSGEYIGHSRRPPLRLLVQNNRITVASAPCVVGRRWLLPDDGDPSQGPALELVLLSWNICAGSVRGSGDYGSRLSLAWRRAGQGSDRYATPAIHPYLQKRLPPERKMESQVVTTT